LIGRVLLDENLPHDLRLVLSEFDVATVRYMGWAGLTNGELLTAAEAAGFAVFVTGDRTVQFEQNMAHRKIGVVSLSAPHWPLVKNHIGKIALAIQAATPGSFTRVDCGKYVRSRRKGLG
jgi:hypothetical protein